jgi:hypothetical protein
MAWFNIIANFVIKPTAALKDYETAQRRKDPTFDPKILVITLQYGMKLEKKI